MAWTRSADPEGTFVRAREVDERVAEPASATRSSASPGLSGKPFAVAALAHLCGLVVVAPFAASNPLFVFPAVIGLTIAYLTLIRPVSLKRDVPSSDSVAAEAPAKSARSAVAQITIDTSLASLPVPLQSTSRCISAVVTPAEVSAELRAELMARVSHELRTPLNAVMGFSDLMGHQMFGPLGHPRYEEYVSHIRESSQRLLKSAEDTLAMTSLMAKSASRSEREPLELASLVREAAAALRSDLRRADLVFSLEIDPEIEVIAHRRALRQALVNVLCEAAARADDGAALCVSASADLDRVALIVTADRIQPANTEEQRSLPICLARTLLELDGCHLFEDTVPQMPWSVLLSLDAVAQKDFFASSSLN